MQVPTKDIFDMVTSHGLPLEVIDMLCDDNGYTYDIEEYNKLWEEHKNKSRNNRKKQVFNHGLDN